MNRRPFIVAVEGINGSGKTTVVDMCADLMAGLGYRVGKTRLPGSSCAPVCAEIRKILDVHGKDMTDDAKTMLYMADYAEYCHKVIERNIMDVDVLFTDRSVFSLLAYQGEMMGYKTLIIDFIDSYLPASWVFPDKLIFLEVRVADALSRIKKSKGEQNLTVGGFFNKGATWFEALVKSYHSVIRRYIHSSQLYMLDSTPDYKQFGYEGYESYLYPRLNNFIHSQVIPPLQKRLKHKNKTRIQL